MRMAGTVRILMAQARLQKNYARHFHWAPSRSEFDRNTAGAAMKAAGAAGIKVPNPKTEAVWLP
jgi:hypothetical protein